MAQRVQAVLIDDLDGGEAEVTVRFGLDGAEYEIDLSAGHADALRRALAPYVRAARRPPGAAARRTGRGGRRAAGAGAPHPVAVQESAKSQGIEVKDRDRVPAGLVVKFKAATAQ
jgi:hypothetical protein